MRPGEQYTFAVACKLWSMAFPERVRDRFRRVLGTRAVVGVAALTVVLTSAFVGVLAFVSGPRPEVESRLAYYVLVTAVVFVSAIFRLDSTDRPGTSVLTAVVAVSVASFVLALFAGEGLLYAIDRPGKVLTSQLLVYFLAASLICTGVGVWGLHHWREYAAGPRR